MALRPSPAVVRAGELVSYLAAHPARRFTVSELARAVSVPRATCHSLLLGLMAGGFVRRDSGLGFSLGPACIIAGNAAQASSPALRAAASEAEDLARSASAVAAVALRDGLETRVAAVFDFGPPIGIRPRAGEAIRLVPPFGASMVAWDDDEGIDDWLARAEPALTRHERTRYRTALAAVRRRGYSITVASDQQARLAAVLDQLADAPTLDHGELSRARAISEIAHGEYLAAEVGPGAPTRLVQVSAPVFEPAGPVRTSIMLLGPGHELTAAETTARGDLVRSAARRATVEIGGREPPVHHSDEVGGASASNR